METLKEHRNFRNGLILLTLFLLSFGFYFDKIELISFGIIYGIIAIYNIFTYHQNKKDYERIFKN